MKMVTSTTKGVVGAYPLLHSSSSATEKTETHLLEIITVILLLW